MVETVQAIKQKIVEVLNRYWEEPNIVISLTSFLYINESSFFSLIYFAKNIRRYSELGFVFYCKFIRLCLKINQMSEKPYSNITILLITLILAVGAIYYFSNPKPQHYYDYTFRVADNILNGAVAFEEKQPSWLNEFVPFEGNWYSVFPLGSVLTMMPFAFFKLIGAIKEMPAAFISALTASVICLFLLLIAKRYEIDWGKRILLALGILFGTWMWTNETMAGAWQLALGFAMLGELGAIYFTIYDKRPLLAGFFFAIAFGNRTEILLTAPIFMFLLLYSLKFKVQSSKLEAEVSDLQENGSAKKKHKHKPKNKASETQSIRSEISNLKSETIRNPQFAIRNLIKFCAVPFVLGVLTLIYNYVRFHSFTDFGYARIPGVLDEPWYNHGIFSLYYIPGQAWEMLLKLWESKPKFPFLVPNGFSSSILFSSPFLFLLLRNGSSDKILKYAAWLAIIILTFLLWTHGNSGGWQFGYRYAMVLLPWIFVVLLENSPKKITLSEMVFYPISFLLNAYSIYLFHWSEYIKS